MFDPPDPLPFALVVVLLGVVLYAAGFFRGERASPTSARLVRAEHRRTKAELKKAYGALYDQLVAVFFEVDPVGINFEDNTDEYEPEVGTVLPRLDDARSAKDVRRILTEEFDAWFSGSFSPRAIQELSERVWTIWLGSGLTRDIR